MRKIVAATVNAHKLQEIRAILKGWEILSQHDVGYVGDVEETGETFLENAALKAWAVSKATGLPALADDSGLCVRALSGDPGVHSARYASRDGSNASDEDNRKLLLKNMKDVGDRSAYFESAIVLMFPDGTQVTASGRSYGRILEEETGYNGFGYDCLFYSEELQKSFASATEEEKNSVSHRGRALRQLVEKLSEMQA